MVPRFAHAVLRSGSSGSGLTWLRPHMALAIDHVRVMQRPVVRLDFPGCICSPMEKRVPTRTVGRGFENASGLGFWTSQLSGSIFPAAFVVRWKNAFPQEPLVVGSRTRRV